MQLNLNSDKAIFLQIAEGIEDAILSGAFPEDSQIPSITEFSVTYRINPATALKGITLLVEQGIIYKKRGLGMFVTSGAVEILRNKRKELFYDSYILGLVAEAKRLEISETDIKSMIERGFQS
ncbi:MAG: transcriptional regulator GntR family [Herbinix sp.]|nr:transcriptional regulator GntR family [Herbinix sp.]